MRKTSFVALTTAILAAALVLPALAGEADSEPDDTEEHGAPFFGETKDIKGMSPLESVTIKFQVRGTMRFMLSQSDGDGQFRRSGLGNDVDPEQVVVTCEKPGYRTVEVIRRSMSQEKFAPIEIECLLERGSS